MKNKNKIFFIEESCFLLKNFYLFAEKELNSDSIEIFVDSNIKKTSEKLKKLGNIDDAYAIEGMIGYFESKGILSQISTSGYLDTKNLARLFATKKVKKFLLTQKEAVFETFNRIKDSDIKICKIENGSIEEWKEEAKEKTEAFYVKNDIYINKFDTENLKIVFSPKYGYLKLDRNDQKSGGEGTCYPTYRNLYCKIYNKKHITYANYKKLQSMIELDVFNPSIVWPLDLIYSGGNFVGYVMKQVKGAKNLTELKDDGFVKYQSFAERTEICINILKAIDYLHSKGILIGDLKDDNILINSPGEAFIIDCGSFQIYDYGCDVFTRGWTDKNYKGDDLNKKLRHIEDEYYPINKLIFEILVLKNPYYSKNNTEIDYEDTSTFEFPLEVDDNTASKGKYIIPWLFLSDRVREFFYYYFHDSKNRRITYIKDWIVELELMLKFYKENNY